MQLRSKLPPNIRPGIPWLCGLLAFAVFVAGIGGPSLWIDEGHTWRYAQEPLGTMLSTTLGSTNAVEAAYYVVLHFWIGIAGSSEVALRLPSAVAMAIAVWAALEVGQATRPWLLPPADTRGRLRPLRRLPRGHP